MKNFCTLKDTINRVTGQNPEREKIFANQISRGIARNIQAIIETTTQQTAKNKQPGQRMSKGFKQTFLQRRYTDDQQPHEKMLSIINHQADADQNHNEVSLHTCQNLLLFQSLSCVQPFATPCTVAHQTLLSMGFPRHRYWSGLPFSSPGYLPNPGIKPTSPAWQVDSFTAEQLGKSRYWQ